MPSAKEGWGIAVIEAAQHGVPTVGYRGAGGVNDSIVDGETGLLVDSQAEFVQAVEQLLLDAPLRRRLGAAAQARAGGVLVGGHGREVRRGAARRGWR